MLTGLDQLPHQRLQLIVPLDQVAQVGVQGLLRQKCKHKNRDLETEAGRKGQSRQIERGRKGDRLFPRFGVSAQK